MFQQYIRSIRRTIVKRSEKPFPHKPYDNKTKLRVIKKKKKKRSQNVPGTKTVIWANYFFS